MNILEKELEDLLYEAMLTDEGVEKLRERGLYCNGQPYRQVNLGAYGIADIITIGVYQEPGCNKHLIINVYELKKDAINGSTFFQALGYCKAIREVVDHLGLLLHNDVTFTIKLIGKSIDLSSNFCYLPDIFPNVHLYKYNFDLEKGLTFKRVENYCPSANERVSATAALKILWNDRWKIFKSLFPNQDKTEAK